MDTLELVAKYFGITAVILLVLGFSMMSSATRRDGRYKDKRTGPTAVKFGAASMILGGVIGSVAAILFLIYVALYQPKQPVISFDAGQTYHTDVVYPDVQPTKRSVHHRH